MIEPIPQKPAEEQPVSRGRVTRTEGIRARAMWVVQAGIIPDAPMPELTRQWVLTSEAFYAAGGPDKFAEFRKEAFEYAQQVCDPRYTNWVKTEFIYF